MGWRYRKSINIGGFRINFSKSGIGYSFGLNGLRYTKKANGGTRFTSSLLGTGISYQKDWSKKQNQVKRNYKASENISENLKDEIIKSNLEQSSQNDLINKLNETYYQNKKIKIRKKWLIILSIVSFLLLACSGFFFIPFIGLLIWAFCLPKKITIDLEYDFEENDDVQNKYQKLINCLIEFMNCDKVCEVDSITTNSDIKRSGARTTLGLNSNLSLYEFNEKLKYIQSNIDLKILCVQNKILLILPDILLVQDNEKWFSINYCDLEINYQDSNFREPSNSIPSDTIVLYQKWLHENNDGSRDKRYTNNYQIPVCAYGQIELLSSNGLHIVLMGSNREKTKKLYESFNDFIS